MRIEEITPREYVQLTGQLEGLSFEQATELHGQLTAKYYAYVDLAIKCKKAVEEFKQIAGRVRSSTPAAPLLKE